MLRFSVPFLVLVGFLVSVSPSLSQSTLTLDTTRARQGDLWEAVMQGSPGAPGILAIDSQPGPVSTPLGTLGIGLSPGILLAPFNLDAMGTFRFGLVAPLDPSLIGLTIYLQSAVADAAAPTGFLISNPRSSTLRAPRVFVAQRLFNFFLLSDTTTVDALELGATSPLWTHTYVGESIANDLLHSKLHDMLFVPLGGGLGGSPPPRLLALDGFDGSTVFEMPSISARASLSLDESELFVLTTSQLMRVSLPLGNVVATIPLPAAANYGVCFGEIPATPAKGLLATNAGIHPVDLATDTIGPAIATSSHFTTAVIVGDRIAAIDYVSTGTSNAHHLHVIDGSAGAPIAGSPIPVSSASNIVLLQAVPVASGPTTYAALNTGGSTLSEIQEGPLRITRQAGNLPYTVDGLELSSGGTEWLVPSPSSLFAVDIPSFSSFQVPGASGVFTNSQVTALTSDSLNAAVYFIPQNPTTLAAILILTDPIATAAQIATLPSVGAAWKATDDR